MTRQDTDRNQNRYIHIKFTKIIPNYTIISIEKTDKLWTSKKTRRHSENT
uniref:Uncharacterized protein n=1 Tax=Faecalibaculum rodentium TaxID=1702221 RepID=A0A140DW66_9FIRM|nr:hypothetical protein AALO17_17590 [Faecalibaculum rodentium]